jgi:hypothetical protein
MTRGFIGRGPDLARLHDQLSAVRSSRTGRLLAVRGRRQVGKSALLTRFVAEADAASLFMTAIKNAAPAAHLADLAEAAATSAHPPRDADLLAEPPTSWTDALRRVEIMARSEPLVVVLDEYPWAAAADPTLDSRIQVAWDRGLEHLPVLLVLVGSDLSVMERTVAHDSPLYGRARPFVVDPLAPRDTAEFVAGADALAALDVHLVTGGYPRLVRAASDAGGAPELVRAAVADPFSELVVSAQLTLDAELPPTVSARAVLEAIGDDSRGPAVFGAIADRLPGGEGAAGAQVSRAVATLQEKRLVAVDLPAGAPAGSRLRRYRVTDSYLRFWLRFVRPRLGDVERGRGDLAWAAYQRGWSTWRGRAIEPLVREALWRRAPDLPGLAGTTVVGGWWGRANTVEIDIVALGSPGPLAVGTVKWRENAPITTADMRALDRGAAAAGLPEDALRVAVCPAGATGSGADLVWTADDVLAAG